MRRAASVNLSGPAPEPAIRNRGSIHGRHSRSPHASRRRRRNRGASPILALERSAADPLKVGFIYVGPVGDFGYTHAHDVARKKTQDFYGDKIKTNYVENVPEGPDAERVLRQLAQEGNALIFATSFGFMNATAKVAKTLPEGLFRACDRLYARAQSRDLQRPLLRRTRRDRHHRRHDVEDRCRRLCRFLPDPRSGDGHQLLHARGPQGQSEIPDEGPLALDLV